jgi:hypothetical protein
VNPGHLVAAGGRNAMGGDGAKPGAALSSECRNRYRVGCGGDIGGVMSDTQPYLNAGRSVRFSPQSIAHVLGRNPAVEHTQVCGLLSPQHCPTQLTPGLRTEVLTQPSS